ncbi:hypothetical protein EIP86_007167 [Pleurotus ostreatoroseus]|nr:hypothetical protein EIP86_007167 [Pleurotus ostreatoroseus]
MATLPSSSSGARAERGLLHALIKAAAAADDQALLPLLPSATDADLNAVDEVGRTVLGAAIAGNSWKDADASDASFRLAQRLAILKMLLGHGGLSLYSLNAPQDAMQGVTPLGLAAWLNIPDAVVLLLEECPGSVTVNGMDSRGATPLMYAARDGNLEVVQHLLAHGARPDYWDVHHRTSIYHALRHPQVLHVCEAVLRQRRAQETTGWSPIHHCVSVPNPSSTVLDILYRAGADVSLYTLSGHGTPLHCLAHKAGASTSSSIRSFIHHLVHDLRAPLAALDHEGETCIHVAAEHGDSIEVLSALLDCDTSGAVRNLRNKRGLTALDVVQPRLRFAFGVGAQHVRSESAASFRTIRPPMNSKPSPFTTPPELRSARATGAHHDDTLPMSVLDNLDWISQELVEAGDNVDVRVADDVLNETSSMGARYLTEMLNRVEDAVAELETIRARYQQVAATLENTPIPKKALDEHPPLSPVEQEPDAFARMTMNARSSESTMVSSIGDLVPTFSSGKAVKTVDVAISAVPSPNLSVEVIPEDDDALDPYSLTTPSTPSRPSGTQHALRSVKSLTDIPQQGQPMNEDRGFLGMVSPWVKGLPRKRSKSDLTSNRTSPRSAAQTRFEESLKNRTSRLRAWFKKKLMPDASVRVSIVMELDEEGCAVGREVKTAASAAGVGALVPSELTAEQKSVRSLARTLGTAKLELNRIQEHINSTDRYVSLASRSVTQASQLLQTIVQGHQKSLNAARYLQACPADENEVTAPPSSAQFVNRKDSQDFLPVKIPSSPRDSQLFFPRPPESSPPSLISYASTLIEGPDEDTLRFRKLLTRKIQSRIDGVYDGIEKADVWLRIVRDVVRTVRQAAEH